MGVLLYPGDGTKIDTFVTAVNAFVPQLKVTGLDATSLVSCSDGTTTLSGTTDSYGNYTFNIPHYNTWIVTGIVNLSSTTATCKIDKIKFYQIDITPLGPDVDPILNNNNWEVIQEIAQVSEGSSYWSIGDRKSITLSGMIGAVNYTNVSLYVTIIGFDHNSTLEGTGITFQLGEQENPPVSGSTNTRIALRDSYYDSAPSPSTTLCFKMNNNASNSGGWADSRMRNYICGTSLTSSNYTVISALPAELKSVLKSVPKYTDSIGNGSVESRANVTSVNDYVFLLAEYEVFGDFTPGYANTYEDYYQQQYAYYRDNNSSYKQRYGFSTSSGIGASTVKWWLRTPSITSNEFMAVQRSDQGVCAPNTSSHSLGLAPAFVVG